MGVAKNDWERIRADVVDGANAGEITLSGVTTKDKLLSVIDLTNTSEANVDIDQDEQSSGIWIKSDDTLECSADLSGKKLLVLWADVSRG